MYYRKVLGLKGEAEFVVLNTVHLLPHCKSRNFLQNMLEECKSWILTTALPKLVVL